MNKNLQPTNKLIGFAEWSNLLLTNKCPDCGTIIQNIPDPAQLNKPKMGCIKCNTFFLPKPKTESKKSLKRKPTIREKEKAARLSGGSLYPPLNLNFFCTKCAENDFEALMIKNEFEKEMELQITPPSGAEGISTAEIINEMLVGNIDHIFTFTCRCGTRKFLRYELHERNRDLHYRFAVDLGFHNTCFGCKYSFDKAIGGAEMTFRCDFNLQCPHIRKNPDIFRLAEDEEIV